MVAENTLWHLLTICAPLLSPQRAVVLSRPSNTLVVLVVTYSWIPGRRPFLAMRNSLKDEEI